MKKPIASLLVGALVVSIPGHFAVEAAANGFRTPSGRAVYGPVRASLPTLRMAPLSAPLAVPTALRTPAIPSASRALPAIQAPTAVLKIGAAAAPTTPIAVAPRALGNAHLAVLAQPAGPQNEGARAAALDRVFDASIARTDLPAVTAGSPSAVTANPSLTPASLRGEISRRKAVIGAHGNRNKAGGSMTSPAEDVLGLASIVVMLGVAVAAMTHVVADGVLAAIIAAPIVFGVDRLLARRPRR